MSDTKAAKLAAARKKLKDYQEKKNTQLQGFENDVSPDNQEKNVFDNSNTLETFNDVESYLQPQKLNSSKSIVDTELTVQLSNVNDIHNTNSHHHSSNHLKATEILVAEKQNLESKISSLEHSLQQLKEINILTTSELDFAKNSSIKMETDLRDAKENVKYLQSELESIIRAAEDYKHNENKLVTIKADLEEKLDETLLELAVKKSENCSLLSHLSQLQRELEMTQLHMQQLLTNGSADVDNLKQLEDIDTKTFVERNNYLQNKNTSLEQQVKILLGEKDHLETHYQQYIHQLNEQVQTILAQNQSREIENESLANREAGLIDQISQMEKRIQALQNHISVLENFEKVSDSVPDVSIAELKQLQTQYQASKVQMLNMEKEYEILKNQLSESEIKIFELTDKIEMLEKDQPDLAKLTAANESDKVAAQRATAQNNKLKEELKGLQDAFIAMNNDKLELTEKLQAEKFLNRELTIKLSESEAILKDVQNKLKAKDEEMIRLQSNCCQLEKQSLLYSQEIDQLRHYEVTQSTEGVLHEKLKKAEEQISKLKCEINQLQNGSNVHEEHNKNYIKNTSDDNKSQQLNQIETGKELTVVTNDNLDAIRTEEAMMKLQERFLKTMSQVAELSDEKQNLEHIVLQLQGETETICEYIALYQQQRGILKLREEERAAQIKYMSAERERMKKQLEELQKLITGTQLNVSSQLDSSIQHETLDKMVNLLSEIKQSHLVDPHKQCSNFENFNPCPWCSGKLINV